MPMQALENYLDFQNKQIYILQYKITELVGHGSNAQVYKAVEKDTDKIVAVKVFEKKSCPFAFDSVIENKIHQMKKLISSKICRTITNHEDDQFFYIISDFCNNGNLKDQIVKKGCLTKSNDKKIWYLVEELALIYLTAILKAFSSLHRITEKEKLNFRWHGNLKISNIYFQDNHLMIGDLAYQPKLQSHKSESTLTVNQQQQQKLEHQKIRKISFTNHNDEEEVELVEADSPENNKKESLFQSVESVSEESYLHKQDIYDIGHILYQMLFGEPVQSNPKDSQETKDSFSVIDEQKSIDFKKNDIKISEKTQNLLKSMLQSDSCNRVSFEELFKEFNVKQSPSKQIHHHHHHHNRHHHTFQNNNNNNKHFQVKQQISSSQYNSFNTYGNNNQYQAQQQQQDLHYVSFNTTSTNATFSHKGSSNYSTFRDPNVPHKQRYNKIGEQQHSLNLYKTNNNNNNNNYNNHHNQSNKLNQTASSSMAGVPSTRPKNISLYQKTSPREGETDSINYQPQQQLLEAGDEKQANSLTLNHKKKKMNSGMSIAQMKLKLSENLKIEKEKEKENEHLKENVQVYQEKEKNEEIVSKNLSKLKWQQQDADEDNLNKSILKCMNGICSKLYDEELQVAVLGQKTGKHLLLNQFKGCPCQKKTFAVNQSQLKQNNNNNSSKIQSDFNMLADDSSATGQMFIEINSTKYKINLKESIQHYYNITKMELRESLGHIVVVDLIESNSLSELTNWIEMLEKNIEDYQRTSLVIANYQSNKQQSKHKLHNNNNQNNSLNNSPAGSQNSSSSSSASSSASGHSLSEAEKKQNKEIMEKNYLQIQKMCMANGLAFQAINIENNKQDLSQEICKQIKNILHCGAIERRITRIENCSKLRVSANFNTVQNDKNSEYRATKKHYGMDDILETEKDRKKEKKEKMKKKSKCNKDKKRSNACCTIF